MWPQGNDMYVCTIFNKYKYNLTINMFLIFVLYSTNTFFFLNTKTSTYDCC